MKKCCFLLFLFGLLFSCSKEEYYDYPISLEAIEIIWNGEVRMFIGKEEQFDQDLITKYVETILNPDLYPFTVPNYFNINVNEVKPLDLGILVPNRILLENKDSAIFDSVQSKYSIKKTDDLFLFHSQQIYSVDDDNEFPYILLKYITPYKSYKERYYRNRVVVCHGTYNQLEISLLVYKFSSPVRVLGGTVLNEFNENIAFLGVSDTMAIQEYKLIYK